MTGLRSAAGPAMLRAGRRTVPRFSRRYDDLERQAGGKVAQRRR